MHIGYKKHVLILTILLAAIDALNKAILVDKEACSFRNAAKHHQEIAEIYETEIIDLKEARENWQEAAKLYMADDSRP